MKSNKRKKVSFWTIKKEEVPVRVKFRDKYGRSVSFRATKQIAVPVKITFYAKKKRKKQW